jgi:hypothetical protein
METRGRLAACDPGENRLEPRAGTEAFLARLASEQNRFLDGVAEANMLIPAESEDLARSASAHGRLTREFLDAQRALLRRRAETEAAVADITGAAERRARELAGPRATGARAALPPPSIVRHGDASFDDAMLAALIDGAFEPAEADGAAMRRQLRDVLDEWWRAENQEHQAAIDDANARAAMRLHGASSTPAPVTPICYEAPKVLSPMVSALESTRHEDLDGVLASLLDSLDTPAAPEPQPVVAAPLPVPVGPAFVPTLPPRVDRRPAVDPLIDPAGPPQEAFDRFWGHFSPRGATATGRREWVFLQVLVPAVAVVAVLALVLAIVG